MPKNQKRLKVENQKYALVFNPHAGMKRRILPNPSALSLEDIKNTLEKYQITFAEYPTKYPGHAAELTKELSNKNFKAILVAGGDGTVGEAAQGLIGTDMPLGILPLGSVMNIARMLNIPLDIEKAIMLLKIGRTRKIDMGVIKKMNEVKSEDIPNPNMPKPMGAVGYFIESAGIGLEAQLHENILELERGNKKALFKIIKTLFDFYGYPAKIFIDENEIKTKATIVAVSNGPYTGAAIPLAPSAKLNDHKLTVTLFKMSKWEVLRYFLSIRGKDKRKYSRKIETYQAKNVRIETKVKRLVHADARHYGETPVVFSILPNALNIISGFPEPGKSALIKRTYLDP